MQIQRDAGYRGSAAKLLDVDRYGDTAEYEGYGEIQAEYRLNTGGGTTQKYAPGARGGLCWHMLFAKIATFQCGPIQSIQLAHQS